MIVPKDSRYIPIPQQPSCCVPACISMIMYKNGIPLIPQELLGYHLGLVVRDNDKHLFWNPRTGKKPPSGYGTQIYKKQYHPNVAFKKLNIPLAMAFHGISNFKNADELEIFLENKVQVDTDLLVCFDHSALNGSHDGGHICVVDKMIDRSKIRLIDSQRDEPKWHIVEIALLHKAMLVHTEAKMGGVWEFINTDGE